MLRLFDGADPHDESGETAVSRVDVEPFGGQLVLFDSNEVLHCVFPTTSRRYAATVWIEDGAVRAGRDCAAATLRPSD